MLGAAAIQLEADAVQLGRLSSYICRKIVSLEQRTKMLFSWDECQLRRLSAKKMLFNLQQVGRYFAPSAKLSLVCKSFQSN